MKRLVAFRYFVYIGLVTGLLSLISSASAQKTMQVTIPFAFAANEQLMPAGQYQVRLLNPDVMLLVEDSTKTDKGIFLLIRPESELDPQNRSCLIFLHPGARYYLKEVRIAGLNVRSELTVPRTVKQELALQTSKTESTVEIALR